MASPLATAAKIHSAHGIHARQFIVDELQKALRTGAPEREINDLVRIMEILANKKSS